MGNMGGGDSGGGESGVDGGMVGIMVAALGDVTRRARVPADLSRDHEDDPAVWERRWRVAFPILASTAGTLVLLGLLFVSRA